jgi:hypothetical protein
LRVASQSDNPTRSKTRDIWSYVGSPRRRNQSAGPYSSSSALVSTGG